MPHSTRGLIKIVIMFTTVGVVAVFMGLWLASIERDTACLALAVKAANERVADIEETSERTRRRLDAYADKVDDLSVAFINHHGSFPRRVSKK